jgi:hypothetical protein
MFAFTAAAYNLCPHATIAPSGAAHGHRLMAEGRPGGLETACRADGESRKTYIRE